VLEIADSVMTYRRRYFSAPHLVGVLDLLLRDESNPRSLIYQINVLKDHAAALAQDAKSVVAHLAPGPIVALAVDIRAFRPDETAAQTPEASQLVALLNSWSKSLSDISDEVTNRYFSHSVSRAS
jgi:uncharacterized alpha-E superfamily protein